LKRLDLVYRGFPRADGCREICRASSRSVPNGHLRFLEAVRLEP